MSEFVLFRNIYKKNKNSLTNKGTRFIVPLGNDSLGFREFLINSQVLKVLLRGKYDPTKLYSGQEEVKLKDPNLASDNVRAFVYWINQVYLFESDKSYDIIRLILDRFHDPLFLGRIFSLLLSFNQQLYETPICQEILRLMIDYDSIMNEQQKYPPPSFSSKKTGKKRKRNNNNNNRKKKYQYNKYMNLLLFGVRDGVDVNSDHILPETFLKWLVINPTVTPSTKYSDDNHSNNNNNNVPKTKEFNEKEYFQIWDCFLNFYFNGIENPKIVKSIVRKISSIVIYHSSSKNADDQTNWIIWNRTKIYLLEKIISRPIYELDFIKNQASSRIQNITTDFELQQNKNKNKIKKSKKKKRGVVSRNMNIKEKKYMILDFEVVEMNQKFSLYDLIFTLKSKIGESENKNIKFYIQKITDKTHPDDEKYRFFVEEEKKKMKKNKNNENANNNKYEYFDDTKETEKGRYEFWFLRFLNETVEENKEIFKAKVIQESSSFFPATYGLYFTSFLFSYSGDENRKQSNDQIFILGPLVEKSIGNNNNNVLIPMIGKNENEKLNFEDDDFGHFMEIDDQVEEKEVSKSMIRNFFDSRKKKEMIIEKN